MDVRLSTLLESMLDKFSGADFQEMVVNVENRQVIIRPLWDRPGFAVTSPGEGTAEVIEEDLLALLARSVGESNDVSLRCVLRNNETEVIFRQGRLTVQTKAASNERGQLASQRALHPEPVAAGTRQHFIKASTAQKLLTAIGIMSPNGEIKGDKRRKFYQIDRFIELVSHMLDDWPASEELVVLDCGAGKSYLTFALNYYLAEVLGKRCYFIGIDNDQKIIETARGIQKQLVYRNMEFVSADVSDYLPTKKPHMILSLHACDTATDQAIALGLHCRAKYIIAVPCCQAALTDEISYGILQGVARHPVLKQRLADIITDGLRVLALEAHGYKVSVVEYVSPLDTPKNIMIRAERGTSLPNASPYVELKRTLQVDPWIDRLKR